MAQGKATVSNRNLAQGEGNAVEKRLLYIGEAEKNKNKLVSVNTQTDFAALFGTADTLVANLEAAQLNGGQNWEAKVLVLDKTPVDNILSNDDITALDALAPTIATAQVEGLVIVSVPAASELKALVETVKALLTDLLNKYAQSLFAILSAKAFSEKDWPEYISTLETEINSIAAERIVVAPNTHDGQVNAGILAGRLCRHDVSIADKPMKVLTGAVQALGDPIALSEGNTLSLADLATLDSKRLSVPQPYIGYQGMYWGDANTLAASGSDFSVLENVRIADYASRRIRLRAITMIGDRSINSTPNSMTYTKNEFMKILNRMSRSSMINGKPEVGMIEPPSNDSITLVWETRNKMSVYFMLKPFGCPVEINGYTSIDLSDPE